MTNNYKRPERREAYNHAVRLAQDGFDRFEISKQLDKSIPRYIRQSMAAKALRVVNGKPGAPVGNKNALKIEPRVKLNFRVNQKTFIWLQEQADKKTDGNIGRWLDTLPSYF